MIKKITYQVLNAVDFCHRHNVSKTPLRRSFLSPFVLSSAFTVVRGRLSDWKFVRYLCFSLSSVFRCQTGKHFDNETKHREIMRFRLCQTDE